VDQYDRLKDFKEKCFSEGLVSVYNSLTAFRDQLYRHLLDTVRQLTSANSEYATQHSVETSPSRVLGTFLTTFETFVTWLDEAWAIERAKRPRTLESAKSIFERVSDELLNFRAHLACLYFVSRTRR
jgi:hypothetical protein